MQSTIVLLVATLSIVSAVPLLVQDEDGQQYHLTRELSRERRQEPRGYGGGFANKNVQSGLVGVQNPNGSGGSVGYAHAKRYGHDVSVDAMAPVWSSKNGMSTINAGGGVSHHFGGFGGSRTTDKRVGINFNHRF